MHIETEQEYRDAYVFVDWMRQVFKSGWPREGMAHLNRLENELDAYERHYHPSARRPGVETMCRSCDHVHTGPMLVELDEPPKKGRGCLLCGCRERK